MPKLGRVYLPVFESLSPESQEPVPRKEGTWTKLSPAGLCEHCWFIFNSIRPLPSINSQRNERLNNRSRAHDRLFLDTSQLGSTFAVFVESIMAVVIDYNTARHVQRLP